MKSGKSRVSKTPAKAPTRRPKKQKPQRSGLRELIDRYLRIVVHLDRLASRVVELLGELKEKRQKIDGLRLALSLAESELAALKAELSRLRPQKDAPLLERPECVD